MLCAQALAVVAQALERLQLGQGLDVRYNAKDVQHDLVVWATELGHPVKEAGSDTLHIERHDVTDVER